MPLVESALTVQVRQDVRDAFRVMGLDVLAWDIRGGSSGTVELAFLSNGNQMCVQRVPIRTGATVHLQLSFRRRRSNVTGMDRFGLPWGVNKIERLSDGRVRKYLDDGPYFPDPDNWRWTAAFFVRSEDWEVPSDHDLDELVEHEWPAEVEVELSRPQQWTPYAGEHRALTVTCMPVADEAVEAENFVRRKSYGPWVIDTMLVPDSTEAHLLMLEWDLLAWKHAEYERVPDGDSRGTIPSWEFRLRFFVEQ